MSLASRVCVAKAAVIRMVGGQLALLFCYCAKFDLFLYFKLVKYKTLSVKNLAKAHASEALNHLVT